MDLARQLFYLPDAVLVIDPETAAIIDANERACEDMRVSRAELTAMTVVQIQEDVEDLEHWRSLLDTVRRQPGYLFTGHHRRPDNSLYPVEVSSNLLVNSGREYLISVARDISSRFDGMNRRRSYEAEEWQGLHDIAEGVWEWELATGMLYFSKGLKRLLGYGPEEMRPCMESWKDIIHPEDTPRVLRVLDEHLRGVRHLYEAEYRLRNRNGHYLWIRDRGQVRIRSSDQQPLQMVGLVNNITDLKLMEQELQRQADFDVLTGLMNRRRGEACVEHQLALMRRQGGQLGLCVIDLDDFKQINDMHGHLAGDQALRRVADYIVNFVRRSDLLFRWGGEEFVLACPDTGIEGMQELVTKLCRGIACLTFEGRLAGYRLTISAGVAVFPDHAEDLVNLTARADSALYQAKQQGKNRMVLHEAPLSGTQSAV
ncbi:sensor domain-containing diguanylate cyclase [Marinobacterium marinum]|uniref:Diguanylate cyclase n=1 Tax=Marinobacterium marinum TaxID=2756129 RepID=A0A7W2ACP5_9GAMM|nr:sensor domain-containing diguanylate cyclase [Marinobacterium marinum]MBA4502724.1 diguanylate cyclase [Marinobacterium marinum]